MKNIKHFFINYYSIIKRDFWLITTLNTLAGVAFLLFEVSIVIEVLCMIALIWKTIIFAKVSSIQPSMTSDFDRFSWKYLLSLPLNKRELICSLVIANYLIYIPLVIWILAFLTPIYSMFDKDEVQIENYIGVILFTLPVIAFISLSTIHQAIILPRARYSVFNRWKQYLSYIRNTLVLLAVSLIIFIFLYLVQNKLDIPIIKTIGFGIKLIANNIVSWWALPVIFVATVGLYFSTIRAWQVEKIGYIRDHWEPKRDLPITIISASILYLFLYTSNITVPKIYNGVMHTAVYKKDYEEIEKIISLGGSINERNEFMLSPIFVAARQADLKMFNYLLAKGAKLDGEIKKSGLELRDGKNLLLFATGGGNPNIVEILIQKGFSPNDKNPLSHQRPIHIAAENCVWQTLDKLLKYKIDKDAIDKLGKTALHYAAASNCLEASIILIEVGVNPLTKDSSGKMAIDYVPKGSRNGLVFYLNRKTPEKSKL